MQLLKIKTIPLEYDVKIQNAKLSVEHTESAKLSQHTTPLQINMKTENVKVRMDYSEMRSSMGMKTPADVAREAPAKTQQTANEVTAEYVRQGNAMTKQGMTISQYVKQRILNESVLDTNIGVAPAVPVDISWEPASTKASVKKSGVDIDWSKAARKMEFIPSSFKLVVRQLADVEIEYIGGPQYVPPSADPNFEEK